MVKSYVPEKGDIVWLDFTPQLGHEQRGRRPAIVLSKKSYNQKIGLAIFCPITSKEKGYPFEVKIMGKKINWNGKAIVGEAIGPGELRRRSWSRPGILVSRRNRVSP